jgi:methylglutaconyl-CoA hydratase
VLSAINGPALAGGCGLATLADFSFATPESKFGYTEARIGFIPALVKVFLLRKIGEGKAKEILLSAEIFSAQKAENYGLITSVVEGDALKHAQNYAKTLVEQNSAQSMATIKQMITELPKQTFSEGLDYATNMNAVARSSDDCKHGIESFLKKQKPNWNK